MLELSYENSLLNIMWGMIVMIIQSHFTPCNTFPGISFELGGRQVRMLHGFQDDLFHRIIISLCIMRMTSHRKIILQWHLTSSFRQLLPSLKWRIAMNVHDTRALWREKLVDEGWDIDHRRILRRGFLAVHINSHKCVTVSLY
jgi:hypothetical protein